jgi:HD-GYP domain-containing protein (c-di-GMP phosphodiesterase class II)
MAQPEKDFDILLVGFDPGLLVHIKPCFEELRIKELSTNTEIEAFLDGYQLEAGTVVFVSGHTKGMNHFEVGQSLSSYYQGLHLIFVTLEHTQFETKNLQKNGFTESFLWPIDKQLLLNSIDQIKSKKTGGGAKKYKAVKILDIRAGQNLPFQVSTYMPLNKKYAVLTAAGSISEKKIEMLKTRSVNSVFVSVDQLNSFYEFTADQLIELGGASNDAVSETEKEERRQATVRGLFRSILDTSKSSGDFESGRDLLDQSKKVVENYVGKKTGLDLKKTLNALMGEGKDSYSHAQLVSTIACLLSMGTGIGQPEDLALAGLFHDIGIQGTKGDISIFEYNQLTVDEKKAYEQHPKLSLNLLKEKRITLMPIIAEIIEKHHERVDGKGFPSQLSMHRIPQEAQLLAYADAFEYLTRQKPGQPHLQPLEAHRLIAEKVGLSPELLAKVLGFMTSECTA